MADFVSAVRALHKLGAKVTAHGGASGQSSRLYEVKWANNTKLPNGIYDRNGLISIAVGFTLEG